MAVVTTSAAWPLAAGYVPDTGVYGQPSPQPAVSAVPFSTTGSPLDTGVYGRPSVRAVISLGPQAAPWLFPTVTAVPAASVYTRYPTGP